MRKSPDELGEEVERLKLEEEVVTHKAQIAEKEAITRELKKKYGPKWMQILGINKLTDLTTLRSFLKTAKQGMEKATAYRRNPAFNPVNTGTSGSSGLSPISVLPSRGARRA